MKTQVEVTAEVEIDAPRDAVWAVITDTERLPEWFEEFESAHQESPGPPGPGSVVRYTIRQGHRSGTFEIVEWEPGSKISWNGPPLAWMGGAMRPRGSHELSDAGEGRTRYTGHFRPELSGLQVLLRPYLKRWIRRARRASTLKLKAMVEADSPS